MFRMNLVVGVQIEATEPELAFLVGNVGCNVLGADVLQINDGGLDRGFLLSTTVPRTVRSSDSRPLPCAKSAGAENAISMRRASLLDAFMVFLPPAAHLECQVLSISSTGIDLARLGLKAMGLDH